MKQNFIRISSCIGFALTAAPAQAHLVQTGFGDFYDGIAHVAVTPEDLLLVIALALLAGQRGTQAARYAMCALPLAWLAGGILSANWITTVSLPLLTTATFAGIGALVAFNVRVPDAIILLLAVVVGTVHGFFNSASMFAAGADSWALIGAVSATLVIVVILAAEVTALKPGWPQVTVRVAGSWIAATGMLMFGWLAKTAG